MASWSTIISKNRYGLPLLNGLKCNPVWDLLQTLMSTINNNQGQDSDISWKSFARTRLRWLLLPFQQIGDHFSCKNYCSLSLCPLRKDQNGCSGIGNRVKILRGCKATLLASYQSFDDLIRSLHMSLLFFLQCTTVTCLGRQTAFKSCIISCVLQMIVYQSTSLFLPRLLHWHVVSERYIWNLYRYLNFCYQFCLLKRGSQGKQFSFDDLF